MRRSQLVVAALVGLLLLPGIAAGVNHFEDLTTYTVDNPNDKLDVNETHIVATLDQNNDENHFVYKDNGPQEEDGSLEFSINLGSGSGTFSGIPIGFHGGTQAADPEVVGRFTHDDFDGWRLIGVARDSNGDTVDSGSNFGLSYDTDYVVNVSLSNSQSSATLRVWNADKSSLLNTQSFSISTDNYTHTTAFATDAATKEAYGDITLWNFALSSPNDVQSVTIDIQDRFEREETGSYTVTAHFSDGSSADVTSQSTDQSNATDILTVDGSGTAEAQDASGWVRVNATFEGVEGEATTIVYDDSLEDYKFVPVATQPAVVFTDWGVFALLVSALFAAGICRFTGEEELTIATYAMLVIVAWLLGFVGLPTAFAAVLVGGTLVFVDR